MEIHQTIFIDHSELTGICTGLDLAELVNSKIVLLAKNLPRPRYGYRWEIDRDSILQYTEINGHKFRVRFFQEPDPKARRRFRQANQRRWATI
jgi:hypothetical protein